MLRAPGLEFALLVRQMMIYAMLLSRLSLVERVIVVAILHSLDTI
jgi:hypothetical protein